MSYALKTNDLYQKYAHTHYLCMSVGTRMHASVDASMCPCKRVCVQREQEKLKLSFSSEPPLMWKVNGHCV